MKTIKILGITLLLAFIGASLSSCDKNDNASKIPSQFSDGDKIFFDHNWSSDGKTSLGFDWFIARGATKCQWIPDGWADPDDYIRPDFSTASYTYTITGENQATLTSTNRQVTSMETRIWTISIIMNFDDHNSGTYSSEETYVNNHVTHSLSGTFEIDN